MPDLTRYGLDSSSIAADGNGAHGGEEAGAEAVAFRATLSTGLLGVLPLRWWAAPGCIGRETGGDSGTAARKWRNALCSSAPRLPRVCAHHHMRA